VQPLLGRYLAPKDGTSWGVYGLVGYRFDWFGIMPFVLIEAADSVRPLSLVSQRVNALSIGLNARPVDAVALKLQYQEAHFPHDTIAGDEPLRLLTAQIAWAF
jgi:hypothetical protein